MDLNKRIVELESRISYQDRTIEELNLVVTEQQQQIDHLIQDIRRIKAHLKQASADDIARLDEEVPPPHY